MFDEYLINLTNFKIIRQLGKGGFGCVYLIENKQTKKQYAAKVSHSQNQKMETFQQEISVYLRANHHRAILPFYGCSLKGFNNKKNCPVIITKYMPKGSLKQTLANNSKLKLSDKYIILRGIAEGMKHLHSKGIIHRDLKPDNILIDDNNYPYICDFGISKISESSISKELAKTQIGTPIYMAPEIFNNKKYTYKVDVYSFSLILYELVTGCSPFSYHHNHIEKVKNGLRPDLSKVKNPIIKNLLTKCWSRYPSKRPTFEQIIQEISKKEFINAMNANENSINKYLNYLNDESYQDDFVLISKEISAQIYKKMADNGDINAMLRYAFLVKNGDGIQKNLVEAACYFKMASEKGNISAKYQLAIMLKNGEGVNKNLQRAFCYFKDAAEKGNVDAMYNYAIMSKNGEGCKINDEEAVKYFKLASENNNINAIFEYACYLYNGKHVEKNKIKAAEYFKKSADKGNVDAMFEYAKMLSNGDEIPTNKYEAAKYFKQSADKENVESMFEYANMLLNGEGVKRDTKKSAEYFKKSADKGNSDAMYTYGKLVLNGVYGRRISFVAAKYFKMAIDNGNINAMYLYSTLLLIGDGVEKNINEALNFLLISVEKGN